MCANVEHHIHFLLVPVQITSCNTNFSGTHNLPGGLVRRTITNIKWNSLFPMDKISEPWKPGSRKVPVFLASFLSNSRRAVEFQPHYKFLLKCRPIKLDIKFRKNFVAQGWKTEQAIKSGHLTGKFIVDSHLASPHPRFLWARGKSHSIISYRLCHFPGSLLSQKVLGRWYLLCLFGFG